MQVPKQIFREYDIRGVADRDLTDEVAHSIGRGLGTMWQDGVRRIAVGRDCRLSSDRLFAALTAGLRRTGLDVVDIGVGPTPYLYSAAHALDVRGGIMITGSHNPGDENGFKIVSDRLSFYGPAIQVLRALIEEDRFAPDARTEGGCVALDHRPEYIERVTSRVTFKQTNVKFVIDAGNGAGGPLGLACMRRVGLNPDPLFCDMDGRFPHHHPDPTVEKNLEALIARVRETGARAGLAYDGDADRLGAVDANGDVIWGDKLLILFARNLLREHPGAAVIGEVKCSQTLYDDIAKHGGRPILWKTGHSLIKTKMKEEHALLAGEMSGHLFFADRYFGYDDAIYAGLRLLEILAHDDRTLGQMLADVPTTFATPELRLDCPDAVKFKVVAAITAHYKNAGREVVDIDGARVQFGTREAPAWGLVRASNTGPVLVMRFEASTEGDRDRLHREVEAEVAKARAALGG
jgi:phosphomannomutase/phosphoglucomutase